MQEQGAGGGERRSVKHLETDMFDPPESWRKTYRKRCGRCWASTARCPSSAKHGWFWGGGNKNKNMGEKKHQGDSDANETTVENAESTLKHSTLPKFHFILERRATQRRR